MLVAHILLVVLVVYFAVVSKQRRINQKDLLLLLWVSVGGWICGIGVSRWKEFGITMFFMLVLVPALYRGIAAIGRKRTA
jgi:cation transporter-like permease